VDDSRRPIPAESSGCDSSDFERGFIKSGNGRLRGFDQARFRGRRARKRIYRMEGKEYVVRDGDVMLFKFNV